MSTPDSLNKELSKITQTTGSVAGGSLDTAKGRASWQIRCRSDISNIVYQLNTVYYNIVKTLTDGRDAGRENALETGIAGTNIICYQGATSGSCYWADLLEKPATIKEVFDCVLGKISLIQNQLDESVEAEKYDDTALVARLDCIELNLLQSLKDTVGAGSYGCDGEADFSYSLASMINALGANFQGFTSIHTAHSGESTVGPYTLEFLSSKITWDAVVAQSNVSNLTTELSCFRTAIGMSTVSDCSNTYSTQTPSSPSAGNNIVADGDSLRKAIRALDQATTLSWSTVGLAAGAGTVSGTTSLVADSANDTLGLIAGNFINLEGTDGPETVRISVQGISLQDSYSQGLNGQINLDNTYSSSKAGIVLRDSATPLDSPLFMVQSTGGTTGYFRIGKHENYADHANYQTYRVDLAASPMYMEPISYTPGTTGSGLSAPYNGTTRGSVWVSSGTSSFQDANGNNLLANHLYYREPNQGTIHKLTCCPDIGDGYTVPSPASTSDPMEEVVWQEASGSDTRLSRAGNDDFLVFREHSGNGGAKHLSIGVVDPTSNQTDGSSGANYYEFNLHDTALMLSKRSSSTNIPETSSTEGSLFVPHDSTTYSGSQVSAGRLYYRLPSNGAIIDLTAAGSGTAQNLFNSIDVTANGGSVTGSGASDVQASVKVMVDSATSLIGETITVANSDGTTVTFTGVAGTTNATSFNTNIIGNANDFATELRAAFEAARVAGTLKMTVSAIANNSNGDPRVITLTQNTGGVNGNNTSASGSLITGGKVLINQTTPGQANGVLGHTGGRTSNSPSAATDTFTLTAGAGIVLNASSKSLQVAIDFAQTSINSLQDVNAGSPAANSILSYNNSSSKYENKTYALQAPSGGSGIGMFGAQAAGGELTVKNLKAADAKLTVVADANNADVKVGFGSVAINDIANVTASSPSSGDALIYNGSAWVSTSSSSARRNAVNKGSGSGILKQINGNDVELKSLKKHATYAAGLTISSTADEIVFSMKEAASVKPISSATHTMTGTYDVVSVDTTSNPVALTLPAANSVEQGHIQRVLDVGGNSHNNNITVNRNGSDTIGKKGTATPVTSVTISDSWASYALYSDGVSKWIQYSG